MNSNTQYIGVFVVASVLILILLANQTSAEEVPRSKQYTSQGVFSDDIIFPEDLDTLRSLQ